MSLKIKNCKNPKWVNAEHTMLDAEVLFTDEDGNELYGGFIPFSATPNDVEEYCREVFKLCVNGSFGEIEEYIEPVIPFEQVQGEKLIELNNWFEWASANAHVMSSLGFEIDADETANRNIDGLITAVEAGTLSEPVYFMDYNNQIQPVTLDNLKTMRLEVIANGQALYQQKWALRSAIEAATTKEELEQIVIPSIENNDDE